ncbi:MAG TPA: ATP-binding protein [Desulfomonilia bacterium]|nr:ATP-binding protein [Desulfomonilia bacterium]
MKENEKPGPGDSKYLLRKVFLRFFLSIFLTIFAGSFILQQVLNYTFKKMIEERLHVYYVDLSRGPMKLMMEDLGRISREKWPGRMKEMQSYFGFPIALTPAREMQLSKDEMQSLMAGRIVVRKEGSLFHQRIPGSDYVLTLGEVKEPGFNFSLQIFAWAMFASLVALLTLAWAIPFARKLKHISSSAIAFGRGDLSRRARVWKWSSLEPLAKSFNAMADRIELLISSHKDLTNAVSHELRTPISRIRFGMEMLQASADDFVRSPYIEGMAKDIDELDALVAELLTYTRLDRERPDLSFVDRPILPWLDEVIDDMKPLMGTLKVERIISREIDGVVLHIEPFMMARAVRNILLNASHHARARVAISVERLGEECLIRIDDDGPGVPEEGREEIFRPFVRLDASRDRKTGSHGLGLAIVARILTWHGGKASVSDSPLGGARFTLSWPAFPK